MIRTLLSAVYYGAQYRIARAVRVWLERQGRPATHEREPQTADDWREARDDAAADYLRAVTSAREAARRHRAAVEALAMLGTINAKGGEA